MHCQPRALFDVSTEARTGKMIDFSGLTAVRAQNKRACED
jgi:hypothetical protein